MEFDFLKQHGYGVVYGADAVRAKIIELGRLSQKEKNMDTTMNTEVPVTEPQTIDELMKLLAEKPEGEAFAVTTDDEEPTEDTAKPLPM
jgi:CBS domain-containing protein